MRHQINPRNLSACTLLTYNKGWVILAGHHEYVRVPVCIKSTISKNKKRCDTSRYSDAWSLEDEKREIQLFFMEHQLAQMGRYHPNRGHRCFPMTSISPQARNLRKI